MPNANQVVDSGSWQQEHARDKEHFETPSSEPDRTNPDIELDEAPVVFIPELNKEIRTFPGFLQEVAKEDQDPNVDYTVKVVFEDKFYDKMGAYMETLQTMMKKLGLNWKK